MDRKIGFINLACLAQFATLEITDGRKYIKNRHIHTELLMSGGKMGMIVFELTMPCCGSWNGKWSQADRLHIRTRDERKVPRECWGRDFSFSWDDGWTACVSVRRMSASEARKIERRSDGFCGYDWMIKSICEKGFITLEESHI